MTDRIDHVAEARELIEAERRPSPAGWETADAQHLANLMEAQVHATLALVEQQRIANLIALATDATDRFGNYAGNGGIFSRIYDNPPTESGNVSVKPDIAAALGIQEEQS